MDSLIQITKNTINGAEINSVNAREIHEYLKVKTKFADWIKRAIEKYDFIENQDFIVLKNGNGTNAFIDYIITLEMGKELAMLENNPKGKEIRKQFIDLEKKLLNQKPLTVNEQIALIAQGHQEVEQRLTQIEYKIENDITLTSAQKHHLKKAVNKKVYELISNHKLSEDFIKKGHMRVWKKIKDVFIVSSYMEIPKSKFDEAYAVINLMTIDDLM